MAHAESIDRYYHQITMSSHSAELLLGGDFSLETQQQIQQELNAYFILDPATFLGVVCHEENSGPEKPYILPEKKDFVSEIQAISRIGVQAEYWNMHHTMFSQGSIDSNQFWSTSMLYLFPTRDGRFHVQTFSDPRAIQSFAEHLGDIYPRFPQYALLVNYGGDADFYGPWANSIFPMKVRVGKKMESVLQESLGLSDQLVQSTWDSWHNMQTTYGELFHAMVLNNYVTLPRSAFELLNKAIQKGEHFLGGYAIARLFLLARREIEELDETMKVLSSAFSHETKNPILLHATKTHADNTRLLYEVARENRSDIYHY